MFVSQVCEEGETHDFSPTHQEKKERTLSDSNSSMLVIKAHD